MLLSFFPSNLVLCSSGKAQGLGYSIIDGDNVALLRRENNILIDLLIADQGQTLWKSNWLILI